MNKKCIYCKEINIDLFKGVEHVIPQGFGKFGTQTPTLGCVCDICNKYFGNTLDQPLARDSFEGITRSKKGIKSREKRFQTRLTFTIDEKEDMGGFEGFILSGYDGTTGQMMPPKTQFQIYNNKEQKYDIFFLNQIDNLILPEDIYGVRGSRKTKIFGVTEQEYQLLTEKLHNIGINTTGNKIFTSDVLLDKTEGDKLTFPIFIQGKVDKIISRALVKIIVNFSAFYIGENEVNKKEWQPIKDYIRNNGEGLGWRAYQGPFWDFESETQRLPDNGFNIIVENKGKNLIGRMQIYNFTNYEFILVKDYNIEDKLECGARFVKDQKPEIAYKLKRTVLANGVTILS